MLPLLPQRQCLAGNAEGRAVGPHTGGSPGWPRPHSRSGWLMAVFSRFQRLGVEMAEHECKLYVKGGFTRQVFKTGADGRKHHGLLVHAGKPCCRHITASMQDNTRAHPLGSAHYTTPPHLPVGLTLRGAWMMVSMGRYT